MNFCTNDFSCFEPTRRRNKEYNAARLAVRRKLGELGKIVLPALSKAGLKLTAKTSLHHPYIHNNYSVDSQWLYFAPEKKAIAALKKILGISFADELDSHYTHILLVIGIDLEGLFVSLKINPKAWWDGMNLKNKCQSATLCSEFRELLNNLERFNLKIHDWKKLYPCGDLKKSDIATFLQYYTPGNHWLHLDYRINHTEPVATSPQFTEISEKFLLALIPLYRFIQWSPDNNHIFNINSERSVGHLEEV